MNENPSPSQQTKFLQVISPPVLVKESLISKLKEEKKLALIIDLDKTLIDTFILDSASKSEEWISRDESHRSEFFLFELSQAFFLVRFRPGLHEFLTTLSQKYYLCIYTLSQRSYASIVLNAIDPDGCFFGDRILCADDRPDHSRKCNAHADPEVDHLVVALDDSLLAWTHPDGSLFPSLIQVEPFFFFNIDKHEINPRASVDTALYRMIHVLEDVYNIFFEKNFSHTMLAVNEIKKKIFEGCEICLENYSEENYSIIQSFGGNPHFAFVPYATHIIVSSSNSSMAKKAMEYQGMYVLGESWWKLSYLSFIKMNEHLFSIPNIPCPTNGPKKREHIPLD